MSYIFTAVQISYNPTHAKKKKIDHKNWKFHKTMKFRTKSMANTLTNIDIGRISSLVCNPSITITQLQRIIERRKRREKSNTAAIFHVLSLSKHTKSGSSRWLSFYRMKLSGAYGRRGSDLFIICKRKLIDFSVL